MKLGPYEISVEPYSGMMGESWYARLETASGRVFVGAFRKLKIRAWIDAATMTYRHASPSA